MADDELEQSEEERDRPEDLTDELARKYDPERLLKVVAKRSGGGTPLEHSVRSKYERRFGVDLGHVRIYTGEFAQEFNRQRNAHAVTIGGTGMILMGGTADKAAGSIAGQALLAHELTHVAQQAKGLHRKATFGGAMPFAEEHQVENELHNGGPTADSHAAAEAGHAKMKAKQQDKEMSDKIKARAMELINDQARNHYTRGNDQTRRA